MRYTKIAGKVLPSSLGPINSVLPQMLQIGLPAVNALAADEEIKISSTKPYGCGVKY